MTIPVLTTANTFSEMTNDIQQLIILMNQLTDGAQFNSNTFLVLSKLSVANLIINGAISGLNTAQVLESASNLYLTAARVRANVSNTTPITYDLANGKFGFSGNTSFVPEDANTNLYFTAARARSNISNVSPILYDAANGIISHNVSPATAAVYGNGSFVPIIGIGIHGHVNLAQTTPVLTKVYRNFALQSTRQGINFLSGANVVITVVDDSANGLANVVIDGVWGGGPNPLGYTGFKNTGNLISANTNTVNFIGGSGVTISGLYDPTGAGEANVYFYANAIFDTTNAAFAQANSALALGSAAQASVNANTSSAFIRGKFSNTPTIIYDQTNGIFGHANSGVIATTYGDSSHVSTLTVDAQGHVTNVVNTLISFTGARAVLSNVSPVNYDSTNGIISHANSGVAAATYGDATDVPSITVDARGHVTSVSNVAINYTGARGVFSNVAPINYDGAGTYSHAASGVGAGTYGDSVDVPVFSVTATGHVTGVTNTPIRAGTTAVTGILQLTDSVTSTSTTTAATPNSVKSVKDSLNTLSASLGSMSTQSSSAVTITGGSISGVSISATRVVEQLVSSTPTLNQNFNVDWSVGGISITTNGVHSLTFVNAAAGVNGFLLWTDNLNSISILNTVNWGVGGKPSVAGQAVVSFVTFNGGTSFYASVFYRAV